MRLVMMGTGTFAEPTFEALLSAFPGEVVGLVTQPDREAGSRRGSTRQTGRGMVGIAREAGCPVVQPENVNSPEGLARLRDLGPDLLVVAAYGQILSKEVLAVPTRGAINVHASLLPRYRGAAPVAAAILNGDTLTGVTIIRVTPGLDSGDILAQEPLDIAPDDTTGTLEAKLAVLGARLAVEVVRRYAAGEAVAGTKQDPALVTRAPKIAKEFGQIDWTKPAAHLERFLRAMQPWPTAYTFLHRPGKEPMRVILYRAACRPAVERETAAVPGEVLFRPDGRGFVVRCGQDSILEPLELQPAGKKRMTAEEFVRGYPPVAGCRFGPARPA